MRAEASPDDDIARLMVKTGFNPLAHTCGDAVCRDKRFHALCEFVRTASPEMQFTLWPEDENLAAPLRSQFSTNCATRTESSQSTT